MKRARWEGNEIILTDDMENNSISLVENNDESFEIIGATTIMRGFQCTQSVTPGMSAIIPYGIAYDETLKKLLVNLASVTATFTAADPVSARRDIVEIRRLEFETTLANRQFKNAGTGAISTSPINTETEYNIEVKVVAGSPGGSAPSVEAGWIKIAEVLIPAASSTVVNANIFNVNSVATGLSNTSWTTDITSIHRNGSLSEMKTQLYGLTQSITTISLTVTGLTATATLTSTGQTILARDGGQVLVSGHSGTTYNLGVKTVAGNALALGNATGNGDIFLDFTNSVTAVRARIASKNETTADLDFYTGGNITTPKLSILNSGNVLIGTPTDSTIGILQLETDSVNTLNIRNSTGTVNKRSYGFYAANDFLRLRSFDDAGASAFSAIMEWTHGGNVLIRGGADTGEGLHVGSGGMRVTGTNGSIIIQSTGDTFQMTRNSTNFLWATGSIATVAIGTGPTVTLTDANLICNADQSVTVNTTLLVDTISEKTASAGVTIDGLLIKDSGIGASLTITGSLTATTSLITNTISERTTASGVTIDSVLLKDNSVTATSIFTGTISEKTASAGITFNNIVKVGTISEKTASAGVTFNNVVKVDTISEKTASAGVSVQASSGEQLLTKIIPIGDWDMTTTNSLSVAHTIPDYSKIRTVYVLVRRDSDAATPQVTRLDYDDNIVSGYYTNIGVTNMLLVAISGGIFDNINYNQTSYNRGWITITYEV